MPSAIAAKDQARLRPLKRRKRGIREGTAETPTGGRGLIRGFNSWGGKNGTEATSASTLAVSTAVGRGGGSFGAWPSASAWRSASAISVALVKRCASSRSSALANQGSKAGGRSGQTLLGVGNGPPAICARIMATP